MAINPNLPPDHAEIARIARERIQKMLGKKVTTETEQSIIKG